MSANLYLFSSVLHFTSFSFVSFTVIKMRKGDRKRSVFKKRKRVGLPKEESDLSTQDRSVCELDSEPSTSNENVAVGLGLAQQNLEPEAEVISASKTKIGDIDSKYQNLKDESKDEGNVNIIVNMLMLSEFLKFAVKCVNCESLGLQVEITKNYGLCSGLRLLCSSCGFSNSFLSSPKLPEGKDLFDVNVRLVYGLRSIGKGRQAAKVFCGVMNLPPPPSKFDRYSELLGTVVEDVCFASMDSAIEEAITANDGERDLAIAIDGTWQKRGHTSLNGVISATSFDTGKVVDVAIFSKFCKCLNKQNHSPNCTANYKGSSGGMEVDGAVQIFQRSLDKNIRYTRYLGDGDSKGFSAVEGLGIYGDQAITKLECVGHVQKRMGSRLRRLKQKSKGQKLVDGRPLGGKARLTDAVIDKIQTYYGLAIRRNIKSLEKMREAVWAIYWHMQSTDDNPKHGLCPKGTDSWCRYQKAISNNETFVHKTPLPQVVMKEIKPIFDILSKTELLEKCLHGKTQNPNESVNNVIWSRLPKTVFVGNKTLHLGVYEAIASFNDGFITKCETLKRLKMDIGANMIQAMKMEDKYRIYFAQKQAQELTKKARQARRRRKMKFEEDEEAPDDPSYGAGLF